MAARRIEICVETLADARTAIDAGADRIELCSALALGGLTPSTALARSVASAAHAAGARVHAMVRPRDGDFALDADLLATAIAEGEALVAAGVDGLVFGAGDNGSLDHAALGAFAQAMRAACADIALTLHRVVDLLDDPVAAVEPAIALGFTRILSSGGASVAIDGLPVLAAMVAQARDRLIVMPGSGVRGANAAAILAATGAREVHASASEPVGPAGPRAIELGFAIGERRRTSAAEVAALRRAVDAA